MDTSLNWDDLKYFNLVATTLSIREAAEQSTMSAATLSRRIANLEEKLGEALFIRRANRLTLTPLGKDILAQVHQVRTQVQSIEERCAVRPGRRKIRINTPSSYARLFLLPLLRDVSTRFGDMTFVINNEISDPSQSDIIISFNTPEEDHFSHRELRTIDLRLYRARTSTRTNGLVLWPNTCEEFRFMNDHLRSFMPDAFDVVVMDCADTYVDAVAEGFGIGLICERTVRHHPRRADLEPQSQFVTRTLWLSSRTNATPSALIRQIEQKIFEMESRRTVAG
jgi:DNA-binding transcriptional LysR family regulator